MPNGCVVKGCRSNLDTKDTKAEKLQTFALPTHETMRRKWKRHLNRGPKFKYTDSHRVCERHFTKDSFTNVDSRGRKTKKLHLTPTAFPNLILYPHIYMGIKKRPIMSKPKEARVSKYRRIKMPFPEVFISPTGEISKPIEKLDAEHDHPYFGDNKWPPLLPEEVKYVCNGCSVKQNLLEAQDKKMKALLEGLSDNVSLQEQVKSLQKELEEANRVVARNENLISAIHEIFRPDQIRSILSKVKYAQWSKETIHDCQRILKLVGATYYDFLRLEHKLPWPSTDTLKKRHTKSNVEDSKA